MPQRILAFTTLNDLDRLKEILDHKGQYLRTETLKQHVLAPDESLVIEQHPGFSLILKRIGDPSSGVMEEIPVKCREGDFDSLVELFSTLGYTTYARWIRSRSFYDWFPVLVQMDVLNGFGIVVELLLYGQLKEKESSIDEGLRVLGELGLKRKSEAEIATLKNKHVITLSENM